MLSYYADDVVSVWPETPDVVGKTALADRISRKAAENGQADVGSAVLEKRTRTTGSLRGFRFRVVPGENAATRLGELMDRRAIPALRQLSETPKEEGPAGPVGCGQDEAAEAIRKLNKGH